MTRRSFFLILSSTIFLFLVLLFSLSWGETLLYPWQWPGFEPESMEAAILTQIRLPRTLTALSIGGMLSMAGCMLQGLFKNPLVEPYTLGISGGASLGVAIAFVSGLAGAAGSWSVGACAFAGALAVGFIILIYSLQCNNPNNLLLTGLMIGILCSSVTTLLMSLASPQDMARIITWNMGSLENTDIKQGLFLCGSAIVGLIAGILLSQQVNLMATGHRSARLMGVNTALLIPVLMALSALLTALSVAHAGIIGFVGLVVPHILRPLAGSDYRLLMPLSFIGGGIFLLFCDLIARSLIAPSQLPVGVVSGIFGGTVFICLLLKKRSNA